MFEPSSLVPYLFLNFQVISFFLPRAPHPARILALVHLFPPKLLPKFPFVANCEAPFRPRKGTSIARSSPSPDAKSTRPFLFSFPLFSFRSSQQLIIGRGLPPFAVVDSETTSFPPRFLGRLSGTLLLIFFQKPPFPSGLFRKLGTSSFFPLQKSLLFDQLVHLPPPSPPYSFSLPQGPLLRTPLSLVHLDLMNRSSAAEAAQPCIPSLRPVPFPLLSSPLHPSK